MKPQQIVIGTRGSRLALVQTDLIVRALRANNTKLKINIKIIVTKGDKNQAPIPLDTIGKAWFTKEIEDALLNHEIDLAVHSLKDLPPEVPAGLCTYPVLERDDPRDVLVAKSAASLKSLPHGAVVGTDSLRRKAQLLYHRPDLKVKSMRGNVDSRLKKLETEDYDAVVLAAAGLSRLGLAERITQYFTPSEFVSAAGQAVLAAEVRQNDTRLQKLIEDIQHPNTVLACQAERAFLEIIGGGCKLPVGCYVHINGTEATVYGTVGSMDAKKAVIKAVSGPTRNVQKLAEDLANTLLHESVRERW